MRVMLLSLLLATCFSTDSTQSR